MRNGEPYKETGPLLVLAGPGTGKTFQLAKRVKYLIEEKAVPPVNVTVITFTSAAARNMRERISDSTRPDLFVSYENQPKMICTMHSLGHRILGENAGELGLGESIRVVDSDGLRDSLIGDAAQLAGFHRDDGQETAKCRQFGNCKASSLPKCAICEQYENILRSCCAVDHDDQILLACKALKRRPELLEKYRSCCRHLLVDEYQDINAGQFQLISLLSEGQRDGLFVVGDDDQSIYSWRGGSPEFIRNFAGDFGNEARIKHLQRSFRCHPHVLEGALSVVRKYDESRLPKGSFEYEAKEGAKIQIHDVASDQQEASVVKAIIQRVLPSRTVLVLLPHRGFSRSIVEELKKARIPFGAPVTIPGQGLPLISTLSQWLTDNSDSLSFRECLEALIANPQFGVPSRRSRKPEKLKEREVAYSRISALWKHVIEGNAGSLWAALETEKENDDLCSKAFSTFEQLLVLKDSEHDPASFIAEVVKTLVPWKKTEELLREIDSWIEASGQMDSTGQTSAVQLMTLQGAKGLEAHVVCVVGIQEDVLPRSDSSDEGIAEQSRLMFVSMTRAIEELHLFHARKRSANVMLKPVYKKGKLPDIYPSRFIDSIPDAHKETKYHRA